MRRPGQVLEGLKTLAIVLLLGSALFLIGQSMLVDEVQSLLGVGNRSTTPGRQNAAAQGSPAEIQVKPFQVLIRCQNGRYGLRYDQEAIDQLYHSMLEFPLKEAVGAAERVLRITEEAWQDKLRYGEAWVYFDFPGTLPLRELSAWLGQERPNPALSGQVSALLLEEAGDGILLSYRDEEDGQYYQSNLIESRESALSVLLSTLNGNGALFAFEREDYAGAMSPYTIVLPGERPYPVYTVRNPLENPGNEVWTGILTELSFNPKAASYQAMGTLVQTEGEESLRLLRNGTLIYENLGSETPKLAAADSGMQARAEYAQGILDLLCRDRLGDAVCVLTSAEEDGPDLTLHFTYLLGGVPVQLMQEGFAAEFRFSGGVVTYFELRLRSYGRTELLWTPFPAVQAAAILRSLGQESRELLLSFLDGGEDGELTVSWTAV